MPTPSPIMLASAGAKSAVSMMWVPSVIRLSAVPRATIAVTIGMLIATTDPKVIRRTMIAASRPYISLPPSFCCSTWRTGSPPASTRRPSPPASLAVSAIFSIEEIGRSNAAPSRVTVEKPIEPLLEIAPCPS